MHSKIVLPLKNIQLATFLLPPSQFIVCLFLDLWPVSFFFCAVHFLEKMRLMFCYAFAVDKQKANIEQKNIEENAAGLIYTISSYDS